MKSRLLCLGLAAWIFGCATFLALTPTRAAARTLCNMGQCVGPLDCQYGYWSDCTLGPNWCTDMGCG